MKPRLFIGSSTEALKTAYGVQENLEHDVLCTAIGLAADIRQVNKALQRTPVNRAAELSR